MNLKNHFRNTFLAGILSAIPLAVTAFVLWYCETQTRQLFHLRTPFLGVIAAIAAIYLLGLIVTSVVGRLILAGLDRLLNLVPGLRELYTAWKHIALTPGGTEGVFSKVVLVAINPNGIRSIGFCSGRPIPGDPTTTCVFIPAAPNPTAGQLCLVPLALCQFVNISPEEAFKMILSGGNYISPGLSTELPASPVLCNL